MKGPGNEVVTDVYNAALMLFQDCNKLRKRVSS